MSKRSKKLAVRVTNAQTSGAGAGGDGDRTAGVQIAAGTQNPYFNNNFYGRYQQYALLYYTSWEAQ